MSREVDSVKPDATGQRPLDAAVGKLMYDPRVGMLADFRHLVTEERNG